MTLYRILLLGMTALTCQVASGQPGRIAVGYEPYGMSPFPLQSTGYRASYQILETGELEATYVSATSRLLMMDVGYREVGMRYKHFLSATIHTGLGLVDRTVTMDYATLLTDESTTGVNETDRAIAGNAFVGFESTFWGILTIGTDFITYSQAITWRNRENRFPVDADPSEEDPRSLPFVQKALGSNVQFLRTYIKVGL